MRPFSLQFVLSACAGELMLPHGHGAPPEGVQRVCTDSRQVQAGDLFIALEGERFDGHAFLAEVAAKGVKAVVVNRTKAPPSLNDCAVIAVKNTRQALGKLAAQYRNDFTLPIIAVAGSNGKTTTKELIASTLRQKILTLSSPASFNNDIGVPLTLLNLDLSHQAAVLEAGTNHPGELGPLVQMIRPRYGVLTSIGREHLEFFGTLAGVATEEGRLAELLPATGKLFINGDAPEVDGIVARSAAPVVRVGFSRGHDWRAVKVEMTEAGMSFQVAAPRREFNGEYHLSLLGRHQVVNALFAIAMGAELGLSPTEIQRGLTACPPAKMRLQLSKIGEVQLLDDSYNANADSMCAALETLSDFPCRGRRIAVLGDMAELGAQGDAAHAEVGQYVAELGLGHLFAVGKMAGVMGGAARAAGLSGVREFNGVEAAAAALREFVQPGDVVLLKASRATRLERVGDVLRSESGASPQSRSVAVPSGRLAA